MQPDSQQPFAAHAYFRIAPFPAELTSFAYRERYPLVIFGRGGFHWESLFPISSSETRRSILLLGMSIRIRSPFRIAPIGPPSIASGEMCPIQGPLVPPENLPSVIRATASERPIPAMAAVGESISLMPGPPFGPS